MSAKKKATNARSEAQKAYWERRKQDLAAAAAAEQGEGMAETQAVDTRQIDEALRAAVAEKLDALEAPVAPAAAAPKPVAPAPGEVDAKIRAGIPAMLERPVAAPPSVEQQKHLSAIMAAQGGAGGPAPAKGKRELPGREPGESTTAYAERLADLIVAAEKKKRAALLEARRLKIPVGDLPATYEVALPTRKDASAPPPEAVLKDGWWPTWVPTTNQFGDPDPALTKVQALRDWAYEVVTDGDGKPIQGRLGVLMQGPPTQRAARIAHHTPVGARRPREQEEAMMEFVEGVNRQHGKRVLIATDFGKG